jgi:hypothetical protein
MELCGWSLNFMSEFDQFYAHIDGNPVKHTCQYEKAVFGVTYRCLLQATHQLREFWYCTAHYEWYTNRPDLRQIKFRIHEGSTTTWNLKGVKRLTVNGRFKKHG